MADISKLSYDRNHMSTAVGHIGKVAGDVTATADTVVDPPLLLRYSGMLHSTYDDSVDFPEAAQLQTKFQEADAAITAAIRGFGDKIDLMGKTLGKVLDRYDRTADHGTIGAQQVQDALHEAAAG
jgi:hypothetical protein